MFTFEKSCKSNKKKLFNQINYKKNAKRSKVRKMAQYIQRKSR